jgi:hypothetical protein
MEEVKSTASRPLSHYATENNDDTLNGMNEYGFGGSELSSGKAGKFNYQNPNLHSDTPPWSSRHVSGGGNGSSQLHQQTAAYEDPNNRPAAGKPTMNSQGPIKKILQQHVILPTAEDIPENRRFLKQPSTSTRNNSNSGK